MAREVMGEWIRSGIEADMAGKQSAQKENSSKSEKSVAQRELLGKLASREGIAIRDLEDHEASIETRLLLAGFVASALTGGLSTNSFNLGVGRGSHKRSRIDTITGRTADGWLLHVGSYEGPIPMGETVTMYDDAILSPDYRLYLFGTEYAGMRSGGFGEGVIRQAIYDKLTLAHIEWVEPDPSTYE